MALRTRGPRYRLAGLLALLFCAAVLAAVYYSAVGVGRNATVRQREELFLSSQRLLEADQMALATCRMFVQNAATKAWGSGVGEDPRAAAQAGVAAAHGALTANAQKTTHLQRVLHECKRNLASLQVQLNGAETSNAEGTIDKLRSEEAELQATLAQLQSLDDEARQATRRGLQAMQSALLWQASRLMQRNGNETRHVDVCAARGRMQRYSVVFDIGSTGNRVHVYKFVRPAEKTSAEEAHPNVADVNDALQRAPPVAIWDMKLERELFRQNRVRMSEQETSETVIAAVDSLMAEGVLDIPVEDQPCTPLEFKATAGLRKKGPERAAVTLASLRNHYMAVSPLWVRGEAPARILEGREEGPLAWVTVNYLLGNFRSAAAANATRHTAAIIDLGGGSTQIVFEPVPGAMPATVPPEDQFISANLGGRRVAAYQHSYEGLGLNEARLELMMQVQGMCAGPVHRQKAAPRENRRTLRPAAEVRGDEEDDDDDTEEEEARAIVAERERELKEGYGGSLTHPPDLNNTVRFPCVPLGFVDELGVANNETTTGDGDDGSAAQRATPDFDACVGLFRRYVLGRKEGEGCPGNDCGMWGQHQPSMAQFPGAIYAFSYIHDFTRPHRGDASSDTLTVAQIADIARHRCDSLTLAEAQSRREGAAKMGVRPEYECLHLSYVYALLRHGYGIPEERELTIVKTIHGFETAWTLGAALMTLSSL